MRPAVTPQTVSPDAPSDDFVGKINIGVVRVLLALGNSRNKAFQDGCGCVGGQKMKECEPSSFRLLKEDSAMSGHQSKMALFSLGAAVAVLASLGLSAPGSLEGPEKEKVAKSMPVAAVQVRTLKDRAASDEPREKGCCGGAGQAEHACCSGASGACTCRHRAKQGDQLGALLLARAEEEQKDEGKKDEKMASAEAKAKGEAARKATVDHQKALMKEDVYDCCIKPGCAFCSNAADMCPCAKNLRKGGPVCPECWGGWQAGKGRLTGVKAEDVKVLPKEKMKMMYDMRSKNFEKAEQK